jgi:hypothetical protein
MTYTHEEVAKLIAAVLNGEIDESSDVFYENCEAKHHTENTILLTTKDTNQTFLVRVRSS